MRLYLCPVCKSIVREDEKDNHTCASDRNNDKVYAEPQPDVSEERERKDEKSKGLPSGDLNENEGNIALAVHRNEIENSNETTSLLEDYEQILHVPPSSRKRTHDSMSTSESLGGAMKSGPPYQRQSGGNEFVAKKSKNCSRMRGASAPVLHGGCSLSNAMAPDSAVPGPSSDVAAASVAGPSAVQAQCHRTGIENPLTCDECRFERHCRRHTGDKPHACPDCDRRFTLKGDLTRHLLTHTGERPFACDICGKAFAQKGSLTKHLRSHTGEKPFRCQFCGKEFADKSHCNRHEKNKCCRK